MTDSHEMLIIKSLPRSVCLEVFTGNVLTEWFKVRCWFEVLTSSFCVLTGLNQGGVGWGAVGMWESRGECWGSIFLSSGKDSEHLLYHPPYLLQKFTAVNIVYFSIFSMGRILWVNLFHCITHWLLERNIESIAVTPTLLPTAKNFCYCCSS